MNPDYDLLSGLKDHHILQEIFQTTEGLKAKKLTLASAESCTGGLFATLLTESPGSSKFFLGAVVAYDNLVKTRILGVEKQLFATSGAVSAPVACQMALGLFRLLGADINVSFTGIAGPTGGTEEKPVGLVYSAMAFKDAELKKKTEHIVRRLTESHNDVPIEWVPVDEDRLCCFRILADKLRSPSSTLLHAPQRSRVRWNSCLLLLELIGKLCRF